MHQQGLGDGRLFSLVTSVPVDRSVMDMIADGLGRVHLFVERVGSAEGATQQAGAKGSAARGGLRGSIAGGSEPEGVSLADIRVRFLSTVGATDWDTGEAVNVPIEVVSRPSLLYKQLFGASLGGIVTSVIRYLSDRAVHCVRRAPGAGAGDGDATESHDDEVGC